MKKETDSIVAVWQDVRNDLINLRIAGHVGNFVNLVNSETLVERLFRRRELLTFGLGGAFFEDLTPYVTKMDRRSNTAMLQRSLQNSLPPSCGVIETDQPQL